MSHMGSWHGSEKYDGEVITMQHVIHWHPENTKACKLGCGLSYIQFVARNIRTMDVYGNEQVLQPAMLEPKVHL